MMGTVEQTLIERIFEVPTIVERMERWVKYANSQGIKLKRVLIHPDDWHPSLAGQSFDGLPIEVLK